MAARIAPVESPENRILNAIISILNCNLPLTLHKNILIPIPNPLEITHVLPRSRRRPEFIRLHLRLAGPTCAHTHAPNCRCVANTSRLCALALEIAHDEFAMGVWAAASWDGLADDTGPDSGEGEEDGDESQDCGAGFSEFAAELEGGEDRCCLLICNSLGKYWRGG